jgi:hypothetical protein
MKTHRPWQPHMSSTPLFNPYVPTTGHSTTLDHFDLVEEEGEDEAEASSKESDQAGDSPSMSRRD